VCSRGRPSGLQHVCRLAKKSAIFWRRIFCDTVRENWAWFCANQCDLSHKVGTRQASDRLTHSKYADASPYDMPVAALRIWFVDNLINRQAWQIWPVYHAYSQARVRVDHTSYLDKIKRCMPTRKRGGVAISRQEREKPERLDSILTSSSS
jgi:hypothetical protein